MGWGLMARVELQYVQSFTDRHGKRRHYFRKGRQRVSLPGVPGSQEFMDAYAAALANQPAPTKPKSSAAPGTFAALATAYYGSPHYLSLSVRSRGNYRQIIDRFLLEHGHRRVDQMERQHVVSIMGKMADRPGAAITLLKRIRTLMRFALDLGWIKVDPTYKVRSYRSKEIHTWTEDEIAQFERRWEIGSKQRLGFALHLYTGQRGSDIHRMTWADVAGDVIHVTQLKTGADLTITLHPELQKVLAATSKQHLTILTTEYGKPYSVKGFGQFMSDAITKSGLPDRCKAHGLRKAAARRLAEVGCSTREIMAVTGHKTVAEVERYTVAADQERLNRQAIRKQVENSGSQTQIVKLSNHARKAQK